MLHPQPLEGLSPQAEKIIDPGTPMPMKMMAASGMAPLPPMDLLGVLYTLAYGQDIALGDKARESLVKLPDKILLDTLSALNSKALIDGVASILIKRQSAVERILLNVHADNETIVMLATRLQSERMLEMICSNENRLLGCPDIIEKLYFNKHSRMSSVDRVIELAVRNGIELAGIPAFHEVKKALEGELIFEASDEPTPDDTNFVGAIEQAENNTVSEAEVEEVLQAAESEDEEKAAPDSETEEKVGNLQAALSTMTISQKIRMATLGTASQRSVLIRDANKLVIMAVLKSPAVNDSEVRQYSMLKSLPDEAVRYIASKREWTKQYGVKLNLVNNPRAPIEAALRFMTHLRPNDLRALERSKDVQGVVRNAAKELRKKRMK